MPYSQAAVESALEQWLTTATGLPVQLQEQNGPQPAGDYCSLRISLVRGDGTISTETRKYIPDAPPGQEIEMTHSSRLFLSVTAQAYTTETIGDAAAVVVLQRAKKALDLRSVRLVLKGSGVAVNAMGEVRNLAATAGPRWQGRAALELTVNVVDTVTERTTYIQTTGITVVEGG